MAAPDHAPLPMPLLWRRPPLRYLGLYLDRVTIPIVSVILALAYIGLRSLIWPA